MTHRFGKHPPKIDYRTLRFGNYVTSQLADPPASCDVLARVYEKLGKSDAQALFPMDGNDRVGDCTIAALAHAVTVYRGLLGKTTIMGEPAVLKLYYKLSGGVDSGLNELDVLNYWRKHKVSGDEILAYVSVDPKDHKHVKQAINLFGGVYLGFQVQKNCLQDFDAGKPWTPNRLTHDGHAVYAIGYDKDYVTVLTWGNTQKGSWAWWDKCVDEAYALLSPEAPLATGFDLAQLKSDLAEVAS
jgi:hypothetical protein